MGTGSLSSSPSSNLLGKEIHSAEDLQNARAAVAQAQAEMEVLAKARAILETRSGRRPESEEHEDDEESGEEESEEEESEEEESEEEAGEAKVHEAKEGERDEREEEEGLRTRKGQCHGERKHRSKSRHTHTPDILVIDGSDYVEPDLYVE